MSVSESVPDQDVPDNGTVTVKQEPMEHTDSDSENTDSVDGEGVVVWDAAMYYQSNLDCTGTALLERTTCHPDFTKPVGQTIAVIYARK